MYDSVLITKPSNVTLLLCATVCRSRQRRRRRGTAVPVLDDNESGLNMLGPKRTKHIHIYLVTDIVLISSIIQWERSAGDSCVRAVVGG